MKAQATIKISTPKPFNYFRTMSFQTNYRKISGSDSFENGVYMRAMRIGQEPVILEGFEKSEEEAIEIQIFSDNVLNEIDIANFDAVKFLGCDYDLMPFDEFVRLDKVLNPLIGGLSGLRLTRVETVYESIVNAIIGQQIAATVARVIKERFISQYGVPLTRRARTLFVFPEPVEVCKGSIEDLRFLKLSGKKAEYIYEISQRAMQGELDYGLLNRLPNEEIIQRLIAIRGVGRWTAEWVLLRALARFDALPAGDLALQRMIGEYYFEQKRLTEQDVRTFAEKHWAPFRGLVTSYMFALLREKREQILLS